MLAWWMDAGIGRTDLAVRRSDGSMLWHRNVALESLPLSWARAQNAHGSDIYIRPARGYSWPLLFLDDVTPDMTHRIMRAYAALAIRTSPAGGCHLWLSSTRPLDENERAEAQRWLAPRTSADPRSTSGEHLGRLAGFRNWKRDGVWVNVLAESLTSRPWDPSPALPDAARTLNAAAHPRQTPTSPGGCDTSPSGREWSWVCTMLEAGRDPSWVLAKLINLAQPRRGKDAGRYARRTLHNATLKAASSAYTQGIHP